MVIQGTAHWAKVLGAPGWGYKKQHKEWSVDIAISEAVKKQLLAAGMTKSVIKNKGDDRGDFLTFKRREFKRDGSPGKPIAVFDREGEEWPQNKLIGNGSIVNAKIVLNEQDDGEVKPGLIKLQVWEHVEFEGREGDDEDLPIDTSDEQWD